MDNFTQTPNFIFDLMSVLTPAEFKVIMVIVRQTCGHHADWAKISFSVFTEMTGLTRQGVFNCLESLLTAGQIERRNHQNSFEYRTKPFNSVERNRSTQLNEMVNSVEQSDDEEDPNSFNSVEQNALDENETVQLSRTKSFNSVDILNKKEIAATRAHTREGPEQAAAAVLDEGQARVGEFVREYERLWALLIASDYERDRVTDWAKRVTLQAWTYALQECVGNRKVGHWKYLERILTRVEHEGLPETVPKAHAPPTVNGKINIDLSSI